MQQQEPKLTPGNDKDESRQELASPPSLSLPKGGGAIQGIDEMFSVNIATLCLTNYKSYRNGQFVKSMAT